MLPTDPRDVQRRRFVVYRMRRSCARWTWVAHRGSMLMSTYGARVVRKLMS